MLLSPAENLTVVHLPLHTHRDVGSNVYTYTKVIQKNSKEQ
jgi:hypothetical protein